MSKHHILTAADRVETAIRDLSDDEMELVRQLAFPPPPKRRKRPGPKKGQKRAKPSVAVLKKTLAKKVAKESTASPAKGKGQRRLAELED
jgi:hypothetical protein